MTNRKIGLLCILISILIPLACLGQGKIVRRATPVTTTKPAAKPKQVKPSKPKTKITFSLATTNNGLRHTYSIKDWVALDISEKVKHVKVGLIVESEGSRFLLSLINNMSNNVYAQGVSYTEALNKTYGQLPTPRQLQILSDHFDEVKKALKDIKTDPLSAYGYWCNDGIARYIDNNKPNESEDGMFRLCTDNVEQGFLFPPVELNGNNKFDFTSNSYSDLILFRHKNKYGFIDRAGKVVVPAQYDDVDGSFHDFMSIGQSVYVKSRNDYASVSAYYMNICQNGRWGVIDKTGKVCIPLEYDAINNDITDFTWVLREKLFGCVNTKGEIIIPIQYENPLEYSNTGMIRAKKNDLWGFIDEVGKTVIPFQYTEAGEFSTDTDPLACVSIERKYGYIDRVGKTVIPLQYDYAYKFENGLAAVIKDGKVGFVNKSGDVVIPFSYDVISGYDSKDGYRFNSVDVCIAKKGDKYGLLDRMGREKTRFEFDEIDKRSLGKFIAYKSGVRYYIDHRGHIYNSSEELFDKSDSILAHQGYHLNKFAYGDELYRFNRFNEAYKWLKDFVDTAPSYYAEQIAEGEITIAYYHYNGYSPINKIDYAEAANWFSRAAAKGNREAFYYLGTIYESGFGVPKDKAKAIDFYRKAQGALSSYDRIRKLTGE